MEKGKFILYHTKQFKGKTTYIYYIIAWYFRKNNKPMRQTIKYLGRLSEYEIEYYKNSIACLNNVPDMFPCNINKVFVRKSNEYLSCAVGIHFWDYWDLSTVFKNDSDQKEVSTADIAKILTIMRLVQPCSKKFTTELYQETCLPQLTGISPLIFNAPRIYRELENIEQYREQLGGHIFNFAKKKGYTEGGLLFYDLSSGNITGLRCVMAKWGHCKDGYNIHVVLLLVITPEGYPIYWELLEGNTSDVRTIEGLILKIEKAYGKLESVICFDRGMVSDENLKLVEEKQIEFITALDGNQLKHFDEFIDFVLIDKVKKFDIKKQLDKIKKDLTERGFKYISNNLFFREVKLTDEQKKGIEKTTKKLGLDKRRYFLAFNPELAYLTHKHRKERVQAFEGWVAEYNKELSQALGDRKEETIHKSIHKELRRWKIADVKIDYILLEYKVENKNKGDKIKIVNTYKIKLKKIRESSYKDAKKYDGFWMLITNILENDDEKFLTKMKFNNYFEIYRLKNNIEESFKILSSFVEIEPFYVYKSEHIKAHFTICILSYLLDINIINKIRNCDEINNMSLDNIFHILSKCKQDIIQLDEKVVVTKLTQLTEKQKNILKVLNCEYLVSSEYLTEKNIISINKN